MSHKDMIKVKMDRNPPRIKRKVNLFSEHLFRAAKTSSPTQSTLPIQEE